MPRKSNSNVIADPAAAKVLLNAAVDRAAAGSPREWERFCGIAMVLAGVQRPEGGMTDLFRDSPYWTGDGTASNPLRVSEHAKLAAEIVGRARG